MVAAVPVDHQLGAFKHQPAPAIEDHDLQLFHTGHGFGERREIIIVLVAVGSEYIGQLKAGTAGRTYLVAVSTDISIAVDRTHHITTQHNSFVNIREAVGIKLLWKAVDQRKV